MMELFRRGHGRAVLLAIIMLVLVCSSLAGAAGCASGCSCLLPSDAKLKGLDYCGGTPTSCGYDNTRTTMYCYGSPTTLVNPVITKIPVTLVPVTTPSAACPSGCECITDATAKAKGGEWTRCSENVCGYEQVLTHVADPVPKYCMKQQPAGTCPDGCECMFESAAKEKFGNYERCTSTPCYSVVTGSATVNAYCFRQVTVSPVSCPSGCNCMSEETAKIKGGEWTRCQEAVCGYEQSTATLAAVVQVPKYCMKEKAPACPDGCTCLLEAEGAAKGLEKCDPNAAPCAYHPVILTANDPNSGKPLYCYKTGVTTTVTPSAGCPENCGCMSEAIAKQKFGTYSQCSKEICGYEATATTANGVPEYCFGPGTGVTPTTLPPSDICAYSAAKNTCTGSCKTGSGCTAVGKETDASGATKLVCGCMASGCSFDYTKGACTGTCTAGGESCMVNTLSYDATGKISYAECHCKGGETTTPPATCTLNADNTCSGTCATGAPCTATVSKDDSGAEKVSCGCGGPVIPQPTQNTDVVSSIGNFFRSIFGWK